MANNLYHFIFALFSIAVITTTQVHASQEPAVPAQFLQDQIKDYSANEVRLIDDDLSNIRNLTFRGLSSPAGEKIYVATAGAPGASKSTVLETYIKGKSDFAYVDPDQRSLKLMINTYLQDFTPLKIAEASSMKPLLQGAYDKWRGGSIYIASTLLNEALGKGYNVAHGTTSTGAHMGQLYEKLKAKGYKIVLLLCNSTDTNRVAALKHRVEDQCMCQVDPDDIVNKGKVFPDRFADYFKYGDEIQLYWIDNFAKGPVLAATLERGKKMQILNQTALQQLTAEYDRSRKEKNLQSLQQLITTFEKA